jgi:hypothetical protein
MKKMSSRDGFRGLSLGIGANSSMCIERLSDNGDAAKSANGTRQRKINKCEIAPASFFCGTDVSSFAMYQSYINSTLNKSQYQKPCRIYGKHV